MAGEKTEKATPKRREDERKKGHIFQSNDIVTAAAMLSIFWLFKILGASMMNNMRTGVRGLLSGVSDVTDPGDIKSNVYLAFIMAGNILIPILIVSVVVTIFATMSQTRLLVSGNQIKPDFKRLSPIQGFKRIFSLKSVVELLKALAKITAVGVIIFIELQSRINDVFALCNMSVGSAFAWTIDLIIDIGLKASAAMLAIGVMDYFYQWWSFEKNMRMSKDEIKEEFKETEGNPETKSRIRNVQRRMAKARMMQAVPGADVVIRNPTHYAVALKYDAEGRGAPVVVAKGQDIIALKIVEIAEQNNVFITENKPLAQALFKAVEVGDEIPAEFYKAVAEVLAYIYRLRRAGRM